jgi:tetratricopeptide (TPR) repeat protein
LRFKVVLAVLCFALGLLAWPAVVRADPQQQLQLARVRYENGKYDEAAAILGKLLAIPVEPGAAGRERREVYQEARPIHAACLIALGRVEEADAVILEQYRDDPFYELPPGQFPTPVSDRFIEVGADHRDEIEQWRRKVVASKQRAAADQAAYEKARAERLLALERMAAEERTVIQRSRWLAMVPFGLGQFQNEDIGLGIFFLSTETLGVATTIVSGAIAQNIKDTRCRPIDATLPMAEALPDRKIDCNALTERFDIAQIVNWVAFGASASLIVGGILEAQIGFVEEEVVLRERPIPPRVKMAPQASVTPDGDWSFGVSGQF